MTRPWKDWETWRVGRFMEAVKEFAVRRYKDGWAGYGE